MSGRNYKQVDSMKSSSFYAWVLASSTIAILFGTVSIITSSIAIAKEVKPITLRDAFSYRATPNVTASVTTAEPIDFDTAVIKTNHFNGTLYTAPHTATYEFAVQVQFQVVVTHNDTFTFTLYLEINANETGTSTQEEKVDYKAAGTYYKTMTLFYIVPLVKHDTVAVFVGFSALAGGGTASPTSTVGETTFIGGLVV